MKKRSFCLTGLLFIAIVISLTLWSYGQTPTPPKISDHQKPHTENQRKETKENQPISEILSASGTLKVTKQSNQETPDISYKGNNKTTFDMRMIILTCVIAFAAVVQAIALFCQVYWMREQSKKISRSIGIAQKTANATKIQAEIMEKEYVLKNRAKIRVRDVTITNLIDLTAPKGTLEIVNVGGTPTDIINIGSWFEIGYGKELPTERPDKTEPSNLPNPQPMRLGSGQSHAYPFVDNRNPMSSEAWDHIRRPRGQCTLYAMGYVEYIDITDTTKNARSENTRRTTFFREYRLDKGMIGGHKEDSRFFPVEGYEYEE